MHNSSFPNPAHIGEHYKDWRKPDQNLRKKRLAT
jgi:hypothetical protein